MKKIILTLLIFIIGTAVFAKPNYSYTQSDTQSSAYSGTYVDEEITTPLTQIGIPEEYLEPQVEEQGLEIIWNQWHADVRNFMSSQIGNKKMNYKEVVKILYTVNKDKSISDIVAIYIPYEAFSSKFTQVSSNKLDYAYFTCIYMYVHSTGKCYELELSGPVNYSIKTILKSAKPREISFLRKYSLTDINYVISAAKTIKKAEHNQILTFPNGSKRTSVNVSHGMTNIPSLELRGGYTADMYDDVETIK